MEEECIYPHGCCTSIHIIQIPSVFWVKEGMIHDQQLIFMKLEMINKSYPNHINLNRIIISRLD